MTRRRILRLSLLSLAFTTVSTANFVSALTIASLYGEKHGALVPLNLGGWIFILVAMICFIVAIERGDTRTRNLFNWPLKEEEKEEGKPPS